MNRTVCIRLQVTPEQDEILSATLSASRECFNAVAALGWERKEKNGITLHHATYRGLREAHPELPSQLVISARMKATEALKSAFALQKKGKKVSAPHWERGMVRYDARSFRVEKNVGLVGLSTAAGRIRLPFTAHRQAEKWLGKAVSFATADLLRRPSGWWLHVVVEIRPPEFVPSGRVVGIDLGINRPAVTSTAQFLGKRKWKEIESRYFRLKRKLQSKGTKSAKRHLCKMRRRQRLFRRDCDHVLAKQIVESAGPGSVIVVENLTDIRSRTKQRGSRQRRRHHGWSYAQLRGFTTDKAEANGSIVVAVDPRKTSQRCSKCGFVHRSNRRSQSVFRCRECGYEVNADLNGARNVAWKYHASIGKPDVGGQHVNLPIVGTGHDSLASHSQAVAGSRRC
jgi:IS605 OrfB family transposase